MKPCPSCNNSYLAVRDSYKSHVQCLNCYMEGPHEHTEAEAVAAWDAMPRRLDVPKTADLTLTVDGISYDIVWVHNGAETDCLISWVEKGKRHGTGAFARCNPKDEYNQATGDKLAMRRACGVGNEYMYHSLPALYSAYRKHLREQGFAAEEAALKAAGVEPLAA